MKKYVCIFIFLGTISTLGEEGKKEEERWLPLPISDADWICQKLQECLNPALVPPPEFIVKKALYWSDFHPFPSHPKIMEERGILLFPTKKLAVRAG